MGTRSLTYVHDIGYTPKSTVLCMYRQMDGYPSGMGQDLYEFLKDFTMVNGIGMGEGRKIANGAGCLAAQLVKHFKDGPGSFYLMNAGVIDAGQEYEYHISANTFVEDKVLNIRVVRPSIINRYKGGDEGRRDRRRDKVLFDGTIAEFGEWLKQDNKED